MTELSVRDFQLLLPPGWLRLPLDERAAERVVALARQRVADLPADRRETGLRALVRLMRTAVSEGERAGATDLLLSVASVGDVPVTASCLVVAVPAGGVGLDIAEQQLRDEGGEVSVVPVAGATAARRLTTRELEYDEAVARDLAAAAGHGDDVARLGPAVVHELLYLVPLPGTGDFLSFTFSTAQPDLAEALITLFDAIMATMRWIR